MKTLLKVDTWLPVFSGFYGTMWEGDSDMEMELQNINDMRKEKGLSELSDEEEIEWDYKGYEKAVSEGVTESVGDWLKEKGYIKSYKFQELRSPREYNFSNDSINVQFVLDDKNKKNIAKYLASHTNEFAKHLKNTYTSYDGFISSYSNNPSAWTLDLDITLSDKHMCGSILNFIIECEEGGDFEWSIHEDLSGNGVTVSASNYAELVEAK